MAETGAHEFGSSQDDDPKSKPIATLTYDVLWLNDFPNGQERLVVFTAKSSGVSPTRTFISTTQAKGIDQFYQRYRIVVQKKPRTSGDPYFTFDSRFVDLIENEDQAKSDAGDLRPVRQVGLRCRA